MKYLICLLALFFGSVEAACGCTSNVTVLQKDQAAANSWGYHLLLDCKSCDISAVTSHDTIRAFIKSLVPAIGMTAYGEPIIEHFAEGSPGYFLTQLIETNSIRARFVDMNGDLYLDIISCKKYDPDIAIQVVKRFFNPKTIKMRFITRQA